MFIKPPKRGVDALGSGAFGASRGSRTHKGEDFEVNAGEVIYGKYEGVVTKIGYPYSQDSSTKKSRLKSDLRYVEITAQGGLRHRYFYVRPSLNVGDEVFFGTEIGKAADLKKIWWRMKNHIHYEVKTKDGTYLDPNHFV
jgi:murein DD-endopeptidase MepM/ murein hydrolase activator NlpD